MEISSMRQRLIDAGRLQTDRDRELFDALAEHAPEMIALVYAAALAGIFITENDPKAD
jgi:hypothetical protein